MNLASEEQRIAARNILTTRELEVWEAVDVKGESVRAVAYRLEISHTSVHQRVQRARQKLAMRSRSDFPAGESKGALPMCRSETGPTRLAIALLIQRDGPNCYLCGKETAPGLRCVEHIIPRVHGGTDDGWNLALACFDCNGRKASNFVSMLTLSGRPMYHAV